MEAHGTSFRRLNAFFLFYFQAVVYQHEAFTFATKLCLLILSKLSTAHSTKAESIDNKEVCVCECGDDEETKSGHTVEETLVLQRAHVATSCCSGIEAYISHARQRHRARQPQRQAPGRAARAAAAATGHLQLKCSTMIYDSENIKHPP